MTNDNRNPNLDHGLGASGDALGDNDYDFLQARRLRRLRENLNSNHIPTGGIADRELRHLLMDVASHIKESRESIAPEYVDVEMENLGDFFDQALALPTPQAEQPKLLKPQPQLPDVKEKNGNGKTNGNGHNFLASSPLG